MKLPRIAAVLIAATLGAGASHAQVTFDVPANLPIPKSNVTRAEVVADFLVWRASGLFDLNHRGDEDVDTNSLEYKRAETKYEYLRASPQFAKLVAQIRNDGTAKVVLAQSR